MQSQITMTRLVQLCAILCYLVKFTLALLSCNGGNSISICTEARMQGSNVYVNFTWLPLHENNASCSCFLFAKSDTEILATYETLSASDEMLINTSIRLGNQSFQEATKGYKVMQSKEFKKLQFDGAISMVLPNVCLGFINNSTEIEVVCLISHKKTVPTSVFGTSFTTTIKKTTSKTITQPASSAAEESTPSSTEQSSSSTADVSQHERQPRKINYNIIGGAVGGGFLVVVIVMVVVVIMCRRRRLLLKQSKEPKIPTNVRQLEENTYSVENALYVSADDDTLPSGN